MSARQIEPLPVLENTKVGMFDMLYPRISLLNAHYPPPPNFNCMQCDVINKMTSWSSKLKKYMTSLRTQFENIVWNLNGVCLIT